MRGQRVIAWGRATAAATATSGRWCVPPLVALQTQQLHHPLEPLPASPFSPRFFSAFRFFPSPKQRRSTPRASIAPPPPLPDAQIVRVGCDCALEYVDLKPPPPPSSATSSPSSPSSSTHSDSTTTLVLLHGAPGTYQDFRYLVPHVQQCLPTTRIIGINFPGFGGSSVDESRYFALLDAQRATQLTLQALQQIIGSQDHGDVFLLGHSFGGHAALNLAALNLRDNALNIQGLVLLASAGMTPHRVLRPRESALFIQTLQSSPRIVQRALSHAIKVVYTALLRFPSDFPASHFVAGILRAGTTDFDVICDHVGLLRAARVPTLSVWASDDEFMEDIVPIALAHALRSTRRLAFAGAGHNIQKTRAQELAKEIQQWIQHVQVQQLECQPTQQYDHYDSKEDDAVAIEHQP